MTIGAPEHLSTHLVIHVHTRIHYAVKNRSAMKVRYEHVKLSTYVTCHMQCQSYCPVLIMLQIYQEFIIFDGGGRVSNSQCVSRMHCAL